MANKNYSGTQYVRAQEREDHLLAKIDRCTDNSSDQKKADHAYQNPTSNEEGARTWSF